jgi:hypothetical protein
MSGPTFSLRVLLGAALLVACAACSSTQRSPDAGVDVGIEEDIWLPDAYIHDTVPDDLGACKVPNPHYFPFVELYKGSASILLMKTFADGRAMVVSSDRMMIVGQTITKEVRFPDEEHVTSAVWAGQEVITANHRGQIKIYNAALELQRTFPLVAKELCSRALLLRSGHLLCADPQWSSNVVVYGLSDGAVVWQGHVGDAGSRLVQIGAGQVISFGSRPSFFTIDPSHKVTLECRTDRDFHAVFYDRQEGALVGNDGRYYAPLGTYCSTIYDNDYFLPTGKSATFHNPNATPKESIQNVVEHGELLVLWLVIGEKKSGTGTYLFRLMKRSTNEVLAEAKISNIPNFYGRMAYNATCNYALVAYNGALARVYFD